MRPELEAALAANTDAKYSNSKEARARRSLKNTCLGYLSVLGDAAVDQEALRRFRTADNMTDQLAALAALNNRDCPERAQARAGSRAAQHITCFFPLVSIPAAHAAV